MAPTSASAPTRFGLLQHRLWANLWFDLAGAIAGGRAAGRPGRHSSSRTGAASTTRCSPSRSARCSGSSSIKWHGVTGGEDGLLNIKRLPVEFGFASFSLQSNEALFYFCLALFGLVVVGAVATDALASGPGAQRDQAERDPCGLRRLQRLALQVARVHHLGRRRRARGRDVRHGAAVGLPERDEPAQLRLRGDDGADRRRAWSASGDR